MTQVDGDRDRDESNDGRSENNEKDEKEAAGSGENHAMEIGYYIASIVILFGVLISLYGLLGPVQQDDQSLGINLNLWWGLFMVLFGLVCLAVSYTATRRRARAGGAG